MLDETTAQKLAQELKIDLFTVYREYLQLLFLKYFYHQKGSEKVYFRGGTALHFLFGSFRFSEDLDFTSLLPENKIKVLIGKTLEDLKKEVEEATFKKAKSIANSFSGRIYQKLTGYKFPLTVRLDFSLRERPINVENSYIETIFPVGPYPQVSHLKIEELAAEKVRTVFTRVRGRDIFDLWFLLSQKVLIDWKLVNKKMALYRKTADSNELIKKIKRIPQEEVKDDLTKFLPATHRSLVEKVKTLVLEKLETIK